MSDLRCSAHSKIDGVYEECIPCLRSRLDAAEKDREEARRLLMNLREALAEHDIIVTMYPGGGIQIEQGKPPSPYIRSGKGKEE